MRPTVLITGAGSGIGAACATRFLAEGWEVAAVGRRATSLQALVAGHGERVRPIVADVSQEEGIRHVAEQARAWKPHLSAVIQSAGDFLVAPMERTSSTDFERIWRVTVWAKFALVRELLPALADDDAPPRALIHIASLAAHADFPEETAYISAMHGVVGLARAQDVELRSRGIRASVVSPGLVRTALTERHFPEAALRRALPAGAIADSVWALVGTIRGGGYIGEIFHQNGES